MLPASKLESAVATGLTDDALEQLGLSRGLCILTKTYSGEAGSALEQAAEGVPEVRLAVRITVKQEGFKTARVKLSEVHLVWNL